MSNAALVMTLLLATAFVAIAPSSAADTCASRYFENTVCTVAYAGYCIGGIKSRGPIVSCEEGVIDNCLQHCGDDLPPMTLP
jgi:hypothetical protein